MRLLPPHGSFKSCDAKAPDFEEVSELMFDDTGHGFHASVETTKQTPWQPRPDGVRRQEITMVLVRVLPA